MALISGQPPRPAISSSATPTAAAATSSTVGAPSTQGVGNLSAPGLEPVSSPTASQRATAAQGQAARSALGPTTSPPLSDSQLRGQFETSLQEAHLPLAQQRQLAIATRGLRGSSLQQHVQTLSDPAILESPNRDRALGAYSDLRGQQRAAHGDRLTDTIVTDLTRAVGERRSPAANGQEGLMGRDQARQTTQTLRNLPQAQYDQVRGLLDRAESSTERALILESVGSRGKGLGSRDGATRDQSLQELTQFADTIRGRSREELISRASGLPTGMDGHGQYTGRTCAPAVAQMARAERDPISAWRLTSRDPADIQALANEQRSLGSSVSTDGYTGILAQTGGSYRALRMVDQQGDQVMVGGKRVPTMTRQQAVGDMARQLEAGVDIPISTRPPGQSGGREHAMLVSDVRGAAGSRQFLVSDPQERQSFWVSEQAFLSDSVLSPQLGQFTEYHQPRN